MKTILDYLGHYFLGALASVWNSAWLSVKASAFAGASDCILSQGNLALGWRNYVLIWVSAAVWEAVTYFAKNPLPVIKP